MTAGDRQFDDSIDNGRIGRRAICQQRPDLLAVRTCGGIQDRQGVCAFPDVGAGGLSDEILAGDEVENVVSHLEHDADLPRPLRDCLDLVPGGPGGQGSQSG